MSEIKTHARHVMRHFKQVWDDMDYAQRRLIELNFEIPLEVERRMRRAQIDELESLYRLEARVPELR